MMRRYVSKGNHQLSSDYSGLALLFVGSLMSSEFLNIYFSRTFGIIIHLLRFDDFFVLS